MQRYPSSQLAFSVSTTDDQNALFGKLEKLLKPEFNEWIELRHVYGLDEVGGSYVETDTLFVVYHTDYLEGALQLMKLHGVI